MPTWVSTPPLRSSARSGANACSEGSPSPPVYPLVARGDDAAPLCRRPAVPGGDEAACGLDEGDERDDIVGLEAGLHDQIDAARRQQAIAVAITAIARHEHPRFEGVELGNFLRRGEEVGVGRGENRVGKPDTSTRADALALSSGPAPECALPVRPKALGGEGLVHQTENGPRPIGQPDQRSPQRRSHNEGTSAVDRIDHPTIAALAGNVAVFLANDAVIGKAGKDGLANSPFGGPVRRCDGIKRGSAALAGDSRSLAKVGTDRRARQVSQSVGELQVRSGCRRARSGHDTDTHTRPGIPAKAGQIGRRPSAPKGQTSEHRRLVLRIVCVPVPAP